MAEDSPPHRVRFRRRNRPLPQFHRRIEVIGSDASHRRGCGTGRGNLKNIRFVKGFESFDMYVYRDRLKGGP